MIKQPKRRFMSFQELSLISPVLKAIALKGYEIPSKIQAEAIPPLLEGKHVLGRAETGTGKTAAFLIPIIQKLHLSYQDKSRHPQALILAPTRELAEQIKESMKEYGKFSHLRTLAVYGGISDRFQKKDLLKGIDVLIATPGRLLDLMRQKAVHLKDIKHFVLDEADRMLDMGFIDDVKFIISKLPEEKQMMMFSATLDREVLKLADQYLKDYETIDVAPKAVDMSQIKQSIFYVSKKEKMSLLRHHLQTLGMVQTLIFSKTKITADFITELLIQEGFNAKSIHGDKSQQQRQRALDAFKANKIELLIATDVAARGLDIKALPRIINYDMPEQADAYIHRMGRTGRAGLTGEVFSYCSKDERHLLRPITQQLKSQIEAVIHPFEEVVAPKVPFNRSKKAPSLSKSKKRRY
jgi:ATP-dependent RNA helicase RhlE